MRSLQKEENKRQEGPDPAATQVNGSRIGHPIHSKAEVKCHMGHKEHNLVADILALHKAPVTPPLLGY